MSRMVASSVHGSEAKFNRIQLRLEWPAELDVNAFMCCLYISKGLYTRSYLVIAVDVTPSNPLRNCFVLKDLEAWRVME